MAKKLGNILRATFCVYCGKVEDYSEFIKTTNKIYADNVIPYCKLGLKKMYEKFYADLQSDVATIYYMCALTQMPFIGDAYDRYSKAITETKTRFLFRQYLECLQDLGEERGIDYNDFRQSDLTIDDILKTDGIDYKKEMVKLIDDWGQQDIDDYRYLEEQYQIYSENRDIPPAMEQTLRYLCLALLEVKHSKAICEDTTKLEEKVAKYFKNLKLDDFNALSKSEDEKFLESSVARIENTRPAFYYKDKEMYTDFQGFSKYFDNHIKRPIRNVLLNKKEYKIKK